MAPELFDSDKKHNHAIDYFSVGIILYEMIACSVPFRNNELAATKKVLFPAEQVNPTSENFRDLINKLLKFEPSERLGYEGGP